MKLLPAIAAAAAAALLVCSCSKKEEKRTKAPIRVRIELASTATPTASRTYVGVVEEAAATAVSFTTMGTVRRVLVNEGQTVGRGQLIAEMDDTQARNLLEAAKAAVHQAEDALGRYQLLHERGSLTEAQWVEIQSKVAQARSELAIAQKNVADCRLTAPVSGVVGQKNISAGETAMPSQAVVTIMNIGAVKVRFSVPETEVSAIGPRTRSRISVEAIGREFVGGLIERGIQADALTHTYEMRVHVPNKERALLPGMVAEVQLEPTPSPSLGRGEQSSNGQAETNAPSRFSTPQGGAGGGLSGAEPGAGGALSLPLTAVQQRADGTLFVWTVAPDSSAHRTAVTIGQSMGGRIEVTSGLDNGQRIVTEGYQKLSEGSKVVY